MKLRHLVIGLAMAFTLGPIRSHAETMLVSPPLPPGPGGLVCACTNVGSEGVLLRIGLRRLQITSLCTPRYIAPGSAGECSLGVGSPSACVVRRSDGKSVSSRKLHCTLSSLGADGTATAVLPVDLKYNQ